MGLTNQKSVQRDNVPLAVSVVVFTVFALSLGDALVKYSGTDFVLWQLFVVRSIIVLIVLIGYTVIRQPSVLKFPVGWLAVLIGFMGVLLILRPHTGDINIYAFFPLVSALQTRNSCLILAHMSTL